MGREILTIKQGQSMSTIDFIRGGMAGFIMSLFLFTVMDGLGGADAKIGLAVSSVWLMIEVAVLIFTAGMGEEA